MSVAAPTPPGSGSSGGGSPGGGGSSGGFTLPTSPLQAFIEGIEAAFEAIETGDVGPLLTDFDELTGTFNPYVLAWLLGVQDVIA